MGAAAIPGMIQAGASIIGGIAGQRASQSSSDAQQAALQQMQQRLQEIGLPPDLSKQLILKEFQQAGTLTPELEQQINLGPSAQVGVKSDQATKDVQMQALQAIKARGGAGLTPEERAQYSKLQQQAAADEESKRQQIMQQAAMRGQAGGGQELAAQLLGSQAEANRAAEAGMDISGQASQRALQAMMQGGQLAGQMNQQAFGQDMSRAQAQDEFNRFNVQNQLAQQSRNVGAKNIAQSANLQNLQNINNQNTAQYNAELQRQNQAKQDYWNNRMRQAAGQMGADQNAANQYGAQAAQQQTGAANMATGVGNAFASIYQPKKENKEEWTWG